MFCSECGHKNPPENRFCGMCGARLSSSGEHRAPEHTAEGPGPVQAAPLRSEVAAVAERVGAPPPPEVVSEYAPPRGYGFLRTQTPPPDSRAVDEPTTVSGPSFLGLGEPAANQDEGYSYLFEDEQPSRVGRIIALLLLVALGAAIYLKWQPLKAWAGNAKTWVLNTALSHVQPPLERKAAPTTSDTTIATASTATPATEPAGTLPAVEQSVKPSTVAEQADQDAGIAPAKNSSSAAAAPAPPATPTAAAPKEKEKAPSNDGADNSAAAAAPTPDLPAGPSRNHAKEQPAATQRERKPAQSARQRPAPAAPAGQELVAAGEKFLYGRGVPRNCRQALTYFRAAADKHNVRAYSHLGSLYATGQCVPLDRAQAYSFFSRALAADRDNPYYERNLTMLWRDMSSEERLRATRNRRFE